MYQLELPLWETLKEAAFVPENADLQEIWFSLDATMAPLDTRQQLQVVGDAITQIAQIVQQRSLLTLEEIDSMMQESEPVVPADFFNKFVRQSMHVDFAQFVEPPLPLPRQVSQRNRQDFPNDGRSVVGVVDKVALLKAVAQEPELSDEAAKDKALAAAHDENISGWSEAIARWLQINAPEQLTSLMDLEHGLGMPLVNVWLGLLSSQEQYEWEQHGKFYNEAGEIWLKLERVEGKHYASSRSHFEKQGDGNERHLLSPITARTNPM